MVQAKADWKARLKALDIDGCRPYVVGAREPITGRARGPNIHLLTPEQRKEERISDRLTNAQFRGSMRRIMTHHGLPTDYVCPLTDFGNGASDPRWTQ